MPSKPSNPPRPTDVTEQKRLNQARESGIPWKKWGPYLSERQWGTVREDYSEDGNAWDYFSHDQSRLRAYRWGEDGLGGISDDGQRLCFALALWNGRDPILKERLFGLTNSEGNHGEDVKEYYFYVDSTPTHSYMKYLYKYPQTEFPYRDLVETNRRRSREEFEYELIDTGVFDDNRYFDVFVEYAKESPEDILIRVTVHNRGPEAARLELLPTLWFRNTWSWGKSVAEAGAARRGRRDRRLAPRARRLHALVRRQPRAPLHRERDNASAWAATDAVRQGRVPRTSSRDSEGGQPGTHRHQGRGALRARRARGRRRGRAPAAFRRAGGRGRSAHASTPRFAARLADADEFYQRITPPSLTEDERRVHRQALAGMLWSKQFYFYDVDTWLKEHEAHPLVGAQKRRGAQRRVVPHVQRRHHLDARQVGVPVVRRLGPRVPHRRARARRLRLRQGAAAAHAAQPLQPSERPDPGLRMELQRRESAGARLGDALPLQGRARPRPRGPRVPRARVQGPDAQLQLVGEPQGSAGAQRVRRRLPRPGQHRRVRPQRAAAHRRLARAGRRHRLDGVLLPEHARDRAHPGEGRPAVRGRRVQVPAALHVDRLRDGPHRRAPRRDVGRGGRLLLRRAAPARRQRHAPQGALDGGAAAALRIDHLRGRHACPAPAARAS